jgi:hypothetical protein
LIDGSVAAVPRYCDPGDLLADFSRPNDPPIMGKISAWDGEQKWYADESSEVCKVLQLWRHGKFMCGASD